MARSIDDYKYRYKVVLIGNHATGKSSIINRIYNDTFTEQTQETRGLSDHLKELNVDGKDICLHIWDTAGTERYRSINPMYMRKAAGALLVYDVTRPETFQELPYWIKEITTHAYEPKIMLLGNKVDLKRVVPYEKAEKFAKKNNLHYLETSAKENVNITEAFELLGQLVMSSSLAQNRRESFSLLMESNKTCKGCCYFWPIFLKGILLALGFGLSSRTRTPMALQVPKSCCLKLTLQMLSRGICWSSFSVSCLSLAIS